jgi:hypothetical protein
MGRNQCQQDDDGIEQQSVQEQEQETKNKLEK